MKKFLASLAVLLLSGTLLSGAATPATATSSETYNFNTSGDLLNNFNATIGSGYSSSNYSQTTTGGIADSGAINAPGNLNAVFGSKNSYSIGSQGSKYTFSAFIKSEGGNGYAGMGFSANPAAAGTYSGSFPYRPDDALGISVHGGGFVFHNGATDYAANWNNGSGAGITSVTPYTGFDLIGNTANSVDKWYKIIFIVDVIADSKFNIRVEVWPANGTTGALRNASASAIFEVPNLTNTAISSAPTIKSYINFSGYRVTYYDNFAIDLAGNASIVSAGAPVVLTNSNTVSGSTLTFNGNVTSENGSAVTDRGFVYANHSSPTLSDTKVSVGTGAGTYTHTTANLSGGTYYVRAFATNSTGTTYGADQTSTITEAPTLTWAPTNTSAYVSQSPLTPSAAATSNSSGAITYAVNSAGTTNCTVNSSTGVLTYTAAGNCVVRATVAAAGAYSTATLDKTFTLSANTAPGAPTSVSATAGNAVASVSWTAPIDTGGTTVNSYTVTTSPGGETCSATAPATTCEVLRLTNGTAYTFAVTATNTTGTSAASNSSAAVTPTAPVVAPAPSSGGGGAAPTPTPVAVPQISGVEVIAGKVKGTSVVKVKLNDAAKTAKDESIRVKLFDAKGQVIKEFTVPISGSDPTSLQIELPIAIGNFTVEATTVDSAGVAAPSVAQSAVIIEKKFVVRAAPNKAPVLAGSPIMLGASTLGPITFSPQSALLSSSAKATLLKLAAQLKATKSQLALTGFSMNSKSSAAFKYNLARTRASTVAKFLKNQGLSNVFFIYGYGPLNPVQSIGSARKVEVRFIK